MSNALDPITCTRCQATVTADNPDRPEWVMSHIWAPVNPRPVMPGGTRPDGTHVGPTVVEWGVASDSEKAGQVALLLCASCVQALLDWAYAVRSPRGTAP